MSYVRVRLEDEIIYGLSVTHDFNKLVVLDMLTGDFRDFKADEITGADIQIIRKEEVERHINKCKQVKSGFKPHRENYGETFVINEKFIEAVKEGTSVKLPLNSKWWE